MKVYHGSGNNELKIKSIYPGRYGVTAFFATTNRLLAEDYVKHYKGSLYELEISDPVKKVDFECKDTYSGEMRDIVRKYSKMHYPSVFLLNCVDSPSPYFRKRLADIVCIFKPESIVSIVKL